MSRALVMVSQIMSAVDEGHGGGNWFAAHRLPSSESLGRIGARRVHCGPLSARDGPEVPVAKTSRWLLCLQVGKQ